MEEKTLGMIKKTVHINRVPCDFYLPLMNPKYLSEKNLWDTHDGATDTEKTYRSA